VRLGGCGCEREHSECAPHRDGRFTSPSPDRPVFILAATNYALDQRVPRKGWQGRSIPLWSGVFQGPFTSIFRTRRQAPVSSMRLAKRPACKVTKEGIQLIAERSSGMTIANLEL